MPVSPLLLWIACSGAPEQASSPPTASAPGPAVDQAQQHPPIPADNPAWAWDAGGFVPEFGWYGEPSWAEVRMRVAGHIGVIGRDLARLHAARGDLAAAAAAYGALAERLAAIPAPEQGPAREVRDALRAAAARDRDTLAALAAGEQAPALDGLAGLRRRVLGLSIAPDPAQAQTARAALEPTFTLRTDLDLDAFADFTARHALRVRLTQAALDGVDPLGFTDPWGYWEAPELRRQALALYAAAGALAGLGADDQARLDEHLDGGMPALEGVPRALWASAIAASWQHPDPGFTAEGLGWLPTGDALVDVAAQPGPRAIGRLSRLDLNDPEHRGRLEGWSIRLNAALEADPDAVPGTVDALVAELEASGVGSRYYNIKQARNEGVRRLARAGRYALAREVLARSWPLHHQDWACPNREGILRALDGRLLALAGELDAAQARLEDALAASVEFLRQVDEAERLGPGAPGPRPPSLGPPGGKVGPPGAPGSAPIPPPR